MSPSGVEGGPSADGELPANENRQHWDPERYARNARFVAELGEPLIDLLRPGAGEHILDIGCGDGALSLKIMARGASVLGIDSSAEQVGAARAAGVDARVADAMALDFDQAFDAVFSNAALHWMKRPEAVIAGVARALRPGGRFVAEMGGGGNVARIRAALHAGLRARGRDPEACDPWYFPAPDAYGALLIDNGFEIESMMLTPRPTPLPGEMTAWLETFAESFTKALAPEARPAYLAEVSDALAPALKSETGWQADYVRLRFSARKT